MVERHITDNSTLKELRQVGFNCRDIRAESSCLNENVSELARNKVNIEEVNRNLKRIATSNEKVVAAFSECTKMQSNLCKMVEDWFGIMKNQISKTLFTSVRDAHHPTPSFSPQTSSGTI